MKVKHIMYRWQQIGTNNMGQPIMKRMAWKANGMKFVGVEVKQMNRVLGLISGLENNEGIITFNLPENMFKDGYIDCKAVFYDSYFKHFYDFHFKIRIKGGHVQ